MPAHANNCPRGPAEHQRQAGTASKRGAHLWSEASEVFQVTADPAGLLDDGVDVQLGDLLHEAVFIPLSVLKHWDASQGRWSREPLPKPEFNEPNNPETRWFL